MTSGIISSQGVSWKGFSRQCKAISAIKLAGLEHKLLLYSNTIFGLIHNYQCSMLKGVNIIQVW